jgi:DNA invertase Pin-like site-specific DNA recombinase
MPRIFAYLRLSSSEPEAIEQLAVIKDANFTIENELVVSERIGGHISAMKRKMFRTLVQFELLAGDILVVVKIDRLGCDAADILRTIKHLAKREVKLYVIELTHFELTSCRAESFISTLTAVANMDCAHSVEKIREQIEYDMTLTNS